jgi:hypothetical protein
METKKESVMNLVMKNLSGMQCNGLNSKQINSSTLLGLGPCGNNYPRVSHGANIINALQAFFYPPYGGLTKIAAGETRGTSEKCFMNPIVGSTIGLYKNDIMQEFLADEQQAPNIINNLIE